MNFIWVSSYISDLVIVWLYYRRSDFTLGKRRTWLKIVLCIVLLPLYINLYTISSIFIIPSATVRVVYRIAVYFIWAWLAEGIPWEGALYASLFCVAAYTAFQNLFFGPALADFVTGRVDILPSHILSQILGTFFNIIIRGLYFGAIAKLFPFAGMIGANVSGLIFLVILNVILTYTKASVVTSNPVFDNLPARVSSYFVLLQIALLLALVAFELSRRRTVEAASLEMRNIAAQSLLENIKEHQLSEDAVRSLRHDLKNHAISMQILLDQGDTEAVRSYLNEFLEAAKNPADGYNTGNKLLDGMLKLKLSSAKELGIDTICSLDFSAASNVINNFDLCVIMGNILDNAIEACQAIPDGTFKFIHISGGPAANCQLIKVENSSASRLQIHQRAEDDPVQAEIRKDAAHETSEDGTLSPATALSISEDRAPSSATVSVALNAGLQPLDTHSATSKGDASLSDVSIASEDEMQQYNNYKEAVSEFSEKTASDLNSPSQQWLPLTTKADKTLHGFGLRNVKAALQRYNGSMTISQGDGIYSISMLIPLE